MNLRATHAALYTPIYDEFLLSTYEEYSQIHPKVYDVKEDDSKQVDVDDISGLGRWDTTLEAEAGEPEDPVLGYAKTYTHGKTTKTMQASFEAVDDDEYALMKKQGTAKEMGTGARDRVEYDSAQILVNAFTVAGPDGQYGFDSDHPRNRDETGSTYDNLLSGPFSHDSLELGETAIADGMFSMKNIPIPITGKCILLHPTALRGKVKRVLNERAGERPGTANRDINRFVGAGTTYDYDPVEWVYLNAAMGGSDTAWMIIFPWLGYLKFYWRQRPHFTSWVDENTDVYNFKGRERHSVGYDNWRFGFGSTGL